MYIEEISIEGFKSYAQRTVVQGFDPKFNAITGLNGSGKSNILDSICFVLGITNLQQVRAASLQELVYKQGQAGITRATVSIVFNNFDKKTSPVGLEDSSRITVTRQIVIGGRNKYLINGQAAQPSRVQNLFHSVQLNVNNPHFLIMQGRITKVLNMKPPEILSMLEEAAGTRMYEVKKEAALKTLDKKQTKVDEINKILTEEIVPALEKLRRERAAYQQWLQGTSEIERLKRFCTAYDYVQAVRMRDTSAAELQASKDKVAQLTDGQVEFDDEIAQKQQQLAEVVREKEAMMGNEMKDLSTRAEGLLKELVKLTSTWENKKASVIQEEANKRKVLESMEELRQATEQKRERVRLMDESVAEIKAEADRKEQERRAAEEEYEAVQAGKTGHPGEEKSMAEALSDAQNGAAAAATEAKQMGLRITHLEKELGSKSKVLATKKKETTGQQQALQRMEGEVARLREQLHASGHDEARATELEKVRTEEEPATQALRQRIGQIAADLGLNFHYRDPVRNFDRRSVKGVLARLFTIKDKDMALALEVIAGGRLWNVVIDNEQTGKQLLTNGGLQRRYTFIPLNKIQTHSIAQAKIDRAKQLVGANNVWPALSLIDYDRSLEPAMKFAFGGFFVCRDSDTAKRVAFDRDIMTPCVTLEGDSYNPSGTLTGGSRRGGGQLLVRAAELRIDEQALEQKEAALFAAEQELAAMAAARRQYKQAEKELELKCHKLELLKEQQKQSEVQQLAAEVDRLQADLAGAKEALNTAKQNEKELKEKAVQLERDMARMVKERGSRLKHLEAKCKKTKKDAAAAAKAYEDRMKEGQQLRLELESVDVEENTLKDQLKAVEEEIASASAAAAQLEREVAAKKEEYDDAHDALEEMKKEVRGRDNQVKQIEKEISQLGDRKNKAAMELKKLEHQLKQKEAEQQGGARMVEKLMRQHEWIATERAMFGRQGSDYDFSARDPEGAKAELAERLAEQNSLEKRINKKVMTMFDKAEQECKGLEKRKATVLRDKAKIEEAISELDEKKKEALKITWEKVTKDFGSIFSTLLPGTTAKLDPPQGEDFLKGLEVKVAFGGVWKESLTELSGGQRSLLALSLILALLLFKPAPLYILDEVDAALDLSHTQNIGRMIKNHFPHSQFIVVSLKEGMFNNANVIFRTKFVDGVSTVSRTKKAHAEENEGQNKGKGLSSVARTGSQKENLAP